MVQLTLLGGIALHRGGELVDGRPAQRHHVAILAVLAASPGGHASREKLIGLLWPEHDSAKARHRLSVALHVLRQGLGEDCLMTSGDTVTLDLSCVASDVGDFQNAVQAGRLEEAVGHYRGHFLDGFYLKDAIEFEPWVDGERSRLKGLYCSALERLAEEAEQAADLRAAVVWWGRRAAEDPYSSSVVMKLMRALAAGGDVAAAVRQARTYATLVEGELGVPANPEVMELADELVREGRSAERAPAVPMPSAVVEAPAAEPPAAEPTHRPAPEVARSHRSRRLRQRRGGDLSTARSLAGWAALAVLVTLVIAVILGIRLTAGSDTATDPTSVDAETLPYLGP